MRERAEMSIEDPEAGLERAFIEEYLQERGCSLSTIGNRPAAEQRLLLTQASQYALGRLAEIDARASYVHQIHDANQPKPRKR